jgi:hypothetical protein
MAYYLSDDGMSEFERKGYGLRKEMERLKDLYLAGHISKVEFEKEALQVGGELERLQPSSAPAAAQMLPLLNDWPGIWEQMNGLERKALIGTMFGGLYFDKGGILQRIEAYPPFDQLLALS